ncbi:DUF418 domain-containing protein [Glycomyces sp. TRM65418]|uniref:DUF418 domain-containing protein n=1 Tax=Glycomyces sp. TRM65418 TaxID=2867006 RepID=UPI001CE627D3|nr:DUF418 domain-containing protein [Glycomyces sp. TRM65418]MCC3764159.1 DUF418 domain-containing protein [Glycomyces sp. TRM65418]QZD53844.1 DUF418 domain-containing protein [Glycomyces sp. TRM65418]
MHTTSATAPAATAPAARRLPLLDVLRGVAILGTLGTNIWIFAAAAGEAAPLLGGAGAATDDTVIGAVFELLANGKFLSMLTLLFGVGLAIQFRSGERRGRRWPGRYHWRALFLFAEGTIHFVLVFAWDVLMGYAVTAIVVAWLLTRSVRVQHAVMWIQLALHLAIIGLITAAMFSLDPAEQSDPEIEALYASGSWIEQVQFRLDNALAFRMEPIIAFPFLMFLFLLGVRLFRAGAFGDEAHGRRMRRRMGMWGLGIGLPLNLAVMAGPDPLFFVERYVAAPIVMLGFLGLTGILVDRLRRGPVMAALESLGRTALSGYVLQNLLASAICYGWGLGLAARYGSNPWFVAGLWLAISVVLLVGSRLWLRRFSTGPVELLQRSILR